MADYTMAELKMWNEKIEDMVKTKGLDCYPQEFEVISYDDMLCLEAYTGMPSHYPHWSFGKTYEKQKMLYRYNLSGLPYEMVINSNPCLAYLMKDNTLVLQVLTMSHVYGHNDFFKNNRLFKGGTKAERTIEMFKNHAGRVQGYIQDPSIGYEKVERVLDAAHAIKLQCNWVIGMKEEKEESLLGYLIEHGDLEEWEKDLLYIVLEETKYFIPQIETKVMNEGWASWWHYNMMQEAGLDQGSYLDFLNIHNKVITPHVGRINPYYVGFKIYEDLSKRYPDQPEKLFEVRALERDSSFIRKYLTFELCQEMNLFTYDKEEEYYVVSEVSNEEGWKKVRNTLAGTVGIGNIPWIQGKEIDKNTHTLYLEHEYDGRELEFSYASETLKYVQELWGGQVILKTSLNDESKQIICDKDKKILIQHKA